ncbi:MAG: hypothetical protein BGO14_01735 [Chlamydiales bacterium 38-26]|nr:neutral/alkaline non-lysosomal ceramidase N-terminal domain-containing protein [Chlamydiales bacterium]OJV08168.1 MAG: hypothetical protein BGO14_01735 [Chlamydiales bacterium 38-26]
MIKSRCYLIFLSLIFILYYTANVYGAILAGVGKSEITPPVGSPSAGYEKRCGKGMLGIHDPLLATTLAIDNGEEFLAFCSVDHLGFTYEMVQEVKQKVHTYSDLQDLKIYLGSTHTHSGGGGFLNIPIIGEMLCGPYDSQLTQQTIDRTVQSIVTAAKNLQPAKVGIGYGDVKEISFYRSQWPQKVDPLTDLAIIKVTHLDGSPLAVVYNYALHPTVLNADNLFFSADYVGQARNSIKKLLGEPAEAIFFNGAQAEIIPQSMDIDGYAQCELIGDLLAKEIVQVWQATETTDEMKIELYKENYTFNTQPTPMGLKIPIEKYQSELNLMIFDNQHVFVTIPGELSCVYDAMLKEWGKKEGFRHVSVLGLVNDAHGYIILPEAWEKKTFESGMSWGGKYYGASIFEKVMNLFQNSYMHKPAITY